MKHLLHWFALLLATLLLAAPARAQSLASATPDSAPSSALVAANTQFALDFFHQLNPAPTVNVFFSPYSISTALAMTWAGARGETAAQMAQVLHLSSLPASSIPTAFHDLQTHLNALQASGNFQLAIANSLWPQQGYPFLPAYLALIKSAFASGIFPVDYAANAEAARLHINTWTSDQTNHKIPEIIPRKIPPILDSSTRLVLVNAIYFNGTWLTPFKPDATSSQPFHLANGSSTDVPMMEHYFEVYDAPPYASIPLPGLSGNLQILSLPYKGEDISFVVLLPPTPTALAALTKNLTASQLATWLAQLGSAHEDLDVSLPKFKFSQAFGLADNLQALGIRDAFEYGPANFSGVDSNRNLYISAVLHQAYIDVNEHGTEAAAATAVVEAAGGPPPQPIEFVADHPFLFLILDNTSGSILFLGQYANPPPAVAAKPIHSLR